MLPIRKILCPTDFSGPARIALHEAVEIAGHFGSELLLVHVVPEVPALPCDPADYPDLELPDVNLSDYEDMLSRSAGRKLRDIVLIDIPEGTKTRAIVEAGDPAMTVVNVAAREEVDLIVVATHGHTGWRHFVFGSVAERIVRLAPCNVLTIHSPSVDKPSVNNQR
jgi:nucleotide-binding universal stress UspA family protein